MCNFAAHYRWSGQIFGREVTLHVSRVVLWFLKRLGVLFPSLWKFFYSCRFNVIVSQLNLVLFSEYIWHLFNIPRHLLSFEAILFLLYLTFISHYNFFLISFWIYLYCCCFYWISYYLQTSIRSSISAVTHWSSDSFFNIPVLIDNCFFYTRSNSFNILCLVEPPKAIIYGFGIHVFVGITIH